MSPARQALRVVAFVELATLLLLLINLATVHWEPISSLAGPTHGCAYLLVVILTWRQPGADPRTKAIAVLPAVGGLLVLRRLPDGLPNEPSDTSGDAAAPRTDL
ncbi:hypothetical protein GCM10027569_27840 [Flindersiella endophytica]